MFSKNKDKISELETQLAKQAKAQAKMNEALTELSRAVGELQPLFERIREAEHKVDSLGANVGRVVAEAEAELIRAESIRAAARAAEERARRLGGQGGSVVEDEIDDSPDWMRVPDESQIDAFGAPNGAPQPSGSLREASRRAMMSKGK